MRGRDRLKTMRASMGALFRVPLLGFDEAPGRRIGLVAHGGKPPEQLDLAGPTTFVLGAEREGLPESGPEVRGARDDPVRARRGILQRRDHRSDRALRAQSARRVTHTVSSRPL